MGYKETSSGQITIGDLCNVNHQGTGEEVWGYAPITTDVPDLWTYSDYKTDIQSKIPVQENNLLIKIDSFSNGNYLDIDSIKDALYTLYPEIIENTVMLWGNLYDGGVGLANYDSNNCVLIMCGGVFARNEYVHPVIVYTTQPYKVQITNTGEHRAMIDANVQESGLYDNGLFITQSWNMNYSTPSSAYMTNEYRVFTGAIQCCQSYATTEGIDLYYNVIFSGSAENCVIDYLNNYTSEMPVSGNWGQDNRQYVIERSLQRKIYALSNFVFDYGTTPSVENTDLFGGAESVLPPSPYSPSDTSSSGGGYNGKETRFSEENGSDGLPTDNGLGTGFCELYNATKEQMQDFNRFLYSGITESISNVIKRTITNPIDAVMSCHMLHFRPSISSLDSIYFCGFSSGVSAYKISSRWHEIVYSYPMNGDNMLVRNNFFDGNDKTKLSLFCPYSGMHELNIDDFIHGVLTVRYMIDVLTGECMIQVESETPNIGSSRVKINSVMYTFNGNCAMQLPVSSLDYRNFINASIGAIGSAMASNPIGIAGSIAGASYGISKSGSVTANAGYLGKQTPFIVIQHPEYGIPDQMGDFIGYPSNITKKIKNSGDFVKASQSTVWTKNIHCTDKEMEMIKELFYEGVWCKL